MKQLLGPIALAATFAIAIVGCGASPSTPQSSSAPAAPSSTAATSSVALPTLAPGTTSPSQVALPSSATNSADPCRLLTSAEAEAALGRTVGPPVIRTLSNTGLGNGFDCAYNSVNQEAGPASVHVGILGDAVPRDGWEQAERADADLQEVPGVGELAFFDEHNQSLDAFDQGRWIQVQMINTTRFSELLALLTEIARNAIARI